jgi:hypothetical protein
MSNFEEEIISICKNALCILGAGDLRFRPMRRKTRVNPRRGFVIGRTNLKTKLITIDIFTPINREPKKISSILRTLAHEVAHHQKPPFRQFYKLRWINRQHYPEFYAQVKDNIERLRGDKRVGGYFD